MSKHTIPFFLLLALSCQSPEKQKVSSGPGTETTVWYRKPLRILQTVLTQPDAASYDVDSLVEYMKQVHANVLVINGGGVVDFFQNTLPLANVNPYLGGRDLLAEIVKGCHDQNIKVIARVDFRGVEKERYDLHPDWFAKDEYGKPVILNYTVPWYYAPCYNGYYRNEHAVELISQLFEKYEVDGIWHNAVNIHHTCYCERCRELYKKEYNRNIPLKTGPEKEWEEYYRWHAARAHKNLERMRATVKKYGDDKSYAAEVFDMYQAEQQKHTGINLYSAAEYFDFLVIVSFIADNSAHVMYKDIYYPSALVKFLKSLEPEKSPVILFGGNGTEHRYTYDPPLDSRLWLWEAAASGGGYWNCYFNGDFPANTLDRRNAFLAADAYNYLRENEPAVQGLQPVTDVAVFYSVGTGQWLGDNEFSLPLKGMLRMLEEEHFQYGFISDRHLNRENLEKVKVLILPNTAVMSEKNAGLIRDWVREGGKVMATFQTSLYDENGDKRDNFSLSEVFGVQFTGEMANTETDCYQKINIRNEITAGFGKTSLLPNGGKTLLVHSLSGAQAITGYLPKISNQPPENAFPPTWEPSNPVVVLNHFGKGASVYFANQPDWLNYTTGHPDYNDLLAGSIHHLLGGYNILTTNAPASVHVYLNQSAREPDVYQLSLVNTSSSGLRPLRDLVPVSGITVTLPFEFNSVESLWNVTGSEIKQKGNSLYIDRLNEFCSVKIIR